MYCETEFKNINLVAGIRPGEAFRLRVSRPTPSSAMPKHITTKLTAEASIILHIHFGHMIFIAMG